MIRALRRHCDKVLGSVPTIGQIAGSCAAVDQPGSCGKVVQMRTMELAMWLFNLHRTLLDCLATSGYWPATLRRQSVRALADYCPIAEAVGRLFGTLTASPSAPKSVPRSFGRASTKPGAALALAQAKMPMLSSKTDRLNTTRVSSAGSQGPDGELTPACPAINGKNRRSRRDRTQSHDPAKYPPHCAVKAGIGCRASPPSG